LQADSGTHLNTTSRPALRWWTTSFVLIVVALIACGWLLERSLAAIGGSANGAPDLCAILLSGDCERTLADPRSWFLNLPLAGWGLVYFAAMAGLLVLARFVEGAFELHALLAASALAAAGVAVGLALTALMLAGRVPACPLCLAVHGIDLALLLALQRLVRRPLRDQWRTMRDALERLARAASTSESTRWQLVGFAAVALVAALAWQWVYVEAALRRASATQAPDPARLIAAYRALPEQELPVSAADPRLGPLDAPVHLVVFESFRCAHCRQFASTLSGLRRRFGDRLRVTFKHYPLSSTCNSRLTRDVQPGACELAWAAEAANRQARFWPFHDVLLASDVEMTAADLGRMARRFGLDAARFESDRHSSEVRRRVTEDVALGNRLKLPGTPATFLEGRLVRPASAQHLEVLIQDELKRKSARPSGPAAREWDRRQPADRPSAGG
jgi:protein-disulfide isomerase/uncharacterized membrane protein